jgi:hypothetical protein
MKLRNEQDLLDEYFRAAVIKDILADENVNRRKEHLKRREIYKDLTSKWVMKQLANEELSEATLAMMKNRCANISICKKIVDKLARTYKGGVIRTVDDESANEIIGELVRLLNFDQKQKKIDKYLELHKNAMAFIVPEKSKDDEYKLKMRALAPWQYDVIHDAVDKEVPRVLILTDYTEQNDFDVNKSDDIDNIIADSPDDAGMHHSSSNGREFVWWSDNYHFTTNEHGQIIPGKQEDDLRNPIGMLPAVNYSEDQDGEFWAQGGEDLVDGSILVNLLITDMFSIANMQGYGMPVITGSNLKNNLKLGPNHALLLNYDKDEDAKPEIQMMSANPPLDMWMRSIEQYVALLLSTNKLSPSSISTKLDAAQFPSGIAMLVEMSEATDDIEDKQKMFKDNERKTFDIIKAWHNTYQGNLTPEFDALGKLPEEMDVNIKFNDVKPITTEKEKLETIKVRQELGLNEKVELLMLDNPDLSPEEAAEKLLRIEEEKMKAFHNSFVTASEDDSEDDSENEDEGDGDRGE